MTQGQVEVMDFGGALRALKDGFRIARSGWNGKRMWLAMWKPGTYAKNSELLDNCPSAAMYAGSTATGSVDVAPTIVMRTADGSLVFGWLASQTDLFAEDWTIVPEAT